MTLASVSPAGSSKHRANPKTPAYWIFLPALLASGYLIVVSLSRLSSPLTPPNIFRWTLVLAVFVFLVSLVGPSCRALNRNLAASICAAIILGLYWASGAYIVGMTWHPIVGLFYFWPLWLPVIFVAVSVAISCTRRLDSRWTAGGVVIGGFCGFLAINAAITAREAERNFPRPLDPAVLAADMVTFAKCAQTFASSHSDSGYPKSLAELGPHGSSCVPEALLAHQSKGFAITYQPGESDVAGKVIAYSLKGVEISPKAKDTSSIFTNESGIVTYRFDGPHGKGSTVLYFPGQYACEKVVHSLWEAAGSGPWMFVSGQSTDMVTDRDEYIRRSLLEAVYTAKRSFTLRGYDFRYAFTTAEPTPSDRRQQARSSTAPDILGFTMTARPHIYGVPGIRSYLFIDKYDVSGHGHKLNVYATPEDRAATTRDPTAQPSEFQIRINTDSP
jgi:hypothetical protein